MCIKVFVFFASSFIFGECDRIQHSSVSGKVSLWYEQYPGDPSTSNFYVLRLYRQNKGSIRWKSDKFKISSFIVHVFNGIQMQLDEWRNKREGERAKRASKLTRARPYIYTLAANSVVCPIKRYTRVQVNTKPTWCRLIKKRMWCIHYIKVPTKLCDYMIAPFWKINLPE